jgi:hypothetical protein
LTKDFSSFFTPLFPKGSRKEITKASGLDGNSLGRLKSFLGDPKHTVENRAEKLTFMLKKIGIVDVQTLSSTIPMTLELSEKLISNRNNVAHKGSKVDEDLLYNILFPVSYRVMHYLNTCN